MKRRGFLKRLGMWALAPLAAPAVVAAALDEKPEPDKLPFKVRKTLGEVRVLHPDALDMLQAVSPQVPPGPFLIERARYDAEQGVIIAEMRPIGRSALWIDDLGPVSQSLPSHLMDATARGLEQVRRENSLDRLPPVP